MKYIARQGKKSIQDDAILREAIIEDLEKAKFYLQYEIDLLKGVRDV